MPVDLSDLPVMPLSDADALGEITTEYDPARGEPPAPLPPDSRVIAPPDVPPPGWVAPGGTSLPDSPRSWPGETPGRTKRRIKHAIESRMWDAWQAERAAEQAQAQAAAEQAIAEQVAAEQAALEAARAAPYVEYASPRPPAHETPAPRYSVPPSNSRTNTIQRGFRLPIEADEILAGLAARDLCSTTQEVVACIRLKHRILARAGRGTGYMWAIVKDGTPLPPDSWRVEMDMG